MYLRSGYILYNLEAMQRVCVGIYNGSPCIMGIDSDGTYCSIRTYGSKEEAEMVFEALCDAIECGTVLFDLSGDNA